MRQQAVVYHAMEEKERENLITAKATAQTMAKGYNAVSLFSSIMAQKERTEAEEAQVQWEKEHEEVSAC